MSGGGKPIATSRTLCRSVLPALASILTVACGGGIESRDPDRVKILVVTIDTLRADHLGVYGYGRRTSPAIDRFAQSATRFSRALASSPWTLPSHASLFTGLRPIEHGAITRLPGDAESARKKKILLESPLALEHRTLAEALRDEGFVTAGFVANAYYLGERFQMNQGFSLYRPDRRPGAEMNETILEWIDEHRDDSFFLFVNYMDAHTPYNTQPVPGFMDPPARRDPELSDEFKEWVLGTDTPVPPAMTQGLTDQYDTGIANADRAFGQLVDRLRSLGIYDQTLVVLTSDHGEFLGEHRLVAHSKDLYQEVLAVPLIVKGPGQRQGVVDDVRLTSADVPGLIASRLSEPLSRRLGAVFPDRVGDAPAISELYFSRPGDVWHEVWGPRFRRIRRSLVDGDSKYIHSSDGQHELYDLASDPRESRNLLAAHPELARRLDERLAAALAESEEAPESEVWAASEPTPEEVEELRILGYVE